MGTSWAWRMCLCFETVVYSRRSSVFSSRVFSAAGVSNIPVIKKCLAPGSQKCPPPDVNDVKTVCQLFMLWSSNLFISVSGRPLWVAVSLKYYNQCHTAVVPSPMNSCFLSNSYISGTPCLLRILILLWVIGGGGRPDFTLNPSSDELFLASGDSPPCWEEEWEFMFPELPSSSFTKWSRIIL